MQKLYRWVVNLTMPNAVLATWRRDGRLQMSPVTMGLDAAGRAISSSRETAYKVRNLRRDPRAALCVSLLLDSRVVEFEDVVY